MGSLRGSEGRVLVPSRMGRAEWKGRGPLTTAASESGPAQSSLPLPPRNGLF